MARSSWRLAPSLAVLRDEVNRRWPQRSKRSDGTIGDAAHSARRSEHNPDGLGIVRAIDITAAGIQPMTLVQAAIGDPRVHYVIFNRQIWSRAHGWRPRRYTGANSHTQHVHISIRNATAERASAAVRAAAAADTSPWGIASAGTPPPPTIDPLEAYIMATAETKLRALVRAEINAALRDHQGPGILARAYNRFVGGGKLTVSQALYSADANALRSVEALRRVETRLSSIEQRLARLETR